MNDHHPPIRSLILLGGDSVRMNSPKHMLPIPSSISETGCETPLLIHMLYLHHIFQVKHGDPILRTVTLSVRNDAQRNGIKGLLEKYEDELPADLNISYAQDSLADLGPAAGLVAAWRLDRHAHWLVTGCNHPLFSKAALEALRNQHHRDRKAVTCFVDARGYNQPLLALWAARALEKLAAFQEQNQGIEPGAMLALIEQEGKNAGVDVHDEPYENGVTQVTPSNYQWTKNVDNDGEWEEVEDYLRTEFAHNDA